MIFEVIHKKDIGSKSLRPPSSDALVITENWTFAGLLFDENFIFFQA